MKSILLVIFLIPVSLLSQCLSNDSTLIETKKEFLITLQKQNIKQNNIMSLLMDIEVDQLSNIYNSNSITAAGLEIKNANTVYFMLIPFLVYFDKFPDIKFEIDYLQKTMLNNSDRLISICNKYTTHFKNPEAKNYIFDLLKTAIGYFIPGMENIINIISK